MWASSCPHHGYLGLAGAPQNGGPMDATGLAAVLACKPTQADLTPPPLERVDELRPPLERVDEPGERAWGRGRYGCRSAIQVQSKSGRAAQRHSKASDRAGPNPTSHGSENGALLGGHGCAGRAGRDGATVVLWRRRTYHSMASSMPSPFNAEVLNIAHARFFSADSPSAFETSAADLGPKIRASSKADKSANATRTVAQKRRPQSTRKAMWDVVPKGRARGYGTQCVGRRKGSIGWGVGERKVVGAGGGR